MKVNYLSKREAGKLLEKLGGFSWARGIEAGRPRSVLRIMEEDFTIYRISGHVICERGGAIFPTVHEEYNRELLDRIPAIVVDMGAVPHIARGADVMRPGVRSVRGDFGEGEVVVVRDERNLKPLSICVALESSGKLGEIEKGRIAKNVHHVNDRIWRLVRDLRRLIERERGP